MQSSFDLKSLRSVIRDWKVEESTIALVPTMGNLHAGHISLLQRAREIADRTVVSIFVNPIQFGQGEDYERYPSTLEEDKRKLAAAGLDLLFAPNLTELYPGGTEEDTRITVPQLSDILCGEFRPGHFSGVATVVAKLLINVQPDFALFGEKDYQQLLVIRRLVHDLLIPVRVIGMPIVRESDGLAMSSRNSYLDEQQRSTATVIQRTLSESAARLRERDATIAEVEADGIRTLESAGMQPEYLSVRHRETLAVPNDDDCELVILAAAWLGEARLIDNVQFDRAPRA